MDQKDLKIQALLERLSNTTATKENEIADLRVSLTLVTNERDALKKELEAVKEELDEYIQAASEREFSAAD